MFFWHRNKKFSECELCNFSINWQGGIFLTCKKIQIYLSSYGEKNIACPSINLTSYTPHSDSTVARQVFWTSFLTLLTDFTQELRLCSPATAAIPLLLDCSHILLFSTGWAASAWHAEAHNEWGILLRLSTWRFADTWLWVLFSTHLNPSEWYYCCWASTNMLKHKVYSSILHYTDLSHVCLKTVQMT